MAQDLWDGGTSSWNADGTGSAVIICRDRDLPSEQQDEDEDGVSHDIVALVDASYPDLVALFLGCPQTPGSFTRIARPAGSASSSLVY